MMRCLLLLLPLLSPAMAIRAQVKTSRDTDLERKGHIAYITFNIHPNVITPEEEFFCISVQCTFLFVQYFYK